MNAKLCKCKELSCVQSPIPLLLKNDDLEAINLLLEGKTKCNSVKKAHLEAFKKIIELMSEELKWIKPKVTTVIEPKLENQDEISENSTEVQQSKEVFKFLKSGNCKHGRSGKKPDQQGKICSYKHPPVCKKHEMEGKCMNNRCKKLHLNLCRRFIETKNCDYGDSCRYFHPKVMKAIGNFHAMNVHDGSKLLNSDIPYSYAQAVKKPTSSFLEQTPHIHQPIMSQSSQSTQPFLGQKNQSQVTIQI